MKLKGIIPEHRIHLLPNFKGILISFNESTIDLRNSTIFPGNLYQIKNCDNVRLQAEQLISKSKNRGFGRFVT